MLDQPRRTLLDIFRSALDAVNGRRCVASELATSDLRPPVYLISIGKVACPMARGAHDTVGTGIRGALIVTKHGYGEPLPWPVIESGHPVPDADSLAAGLALVRFVETIPPDASVLVLLSGGASALVEHLPSGADLETLKRMNEWLLGSGRDIVAMNRVRKRLSLIKGGRLAQALAPSRVVCLAISDVPDNDPRFIGSGPLVADDTVEQEPIADAPAAIRDLLARAALPPRSDDLCFANVEFRIIARLSDAMAAAGAAAESRGLRFAIHTDIVSGDAATVGSRLAQEILAADGGVVHVWGGETTVRLPAAPGRGGRAQHLALSAARTFAGREGVYLLAVGSDGTDGPTADAGALVDGGTIERGSDGGLDSAKALADADSGSFLEASGDLVQTGPTGTNVMDLMIGLRVNRST